MEAKRVQPGGPVRTVSSRAVALGAVAAAVAAALVMTAFPAGADDPPIQGGGQATNNGQQASATASTVTPGVTGSPGSNPDYQGAVQWPICWNDGLYHTTQEEQLNDIRREETAGREGTWGWLVCQYQDGRIERGDLQFFPADEPVPAVDPETLARSVTISAGAPEIRTSPPRAVEHLVNLESWYWVDPAAWTPIPGGTCAGTVCVTLEARPTVLRIDPGDGSGVIECPGGGVPYRDDLPPTAQSSDCSHTYQRAANRTVTATIVYDVSWTLVGGPDGGPLGTMTSAPASFDIAVVEAQAVNN